MRIANRAALTCLRERPVCSPPAFTEGWRGTSATEPAHDSLAAYTDVERAFAWKASGTIVMRPVSAAVWAGQNRAWPLIASPGVTI